MGYTHSVMLWWRCLQLSKLMTCGNQIQYITFRYQNSYEDNTPFTKSTTECRVNVQFPVKPWTAALHDINIYVDSMSRFRFSVPDTGVQYIPRNMHTVFALLCFVVVIHWLIFPNPSGLLHWHCGNLTIAPVPAKQPWWIWINTWCELIMNDCITTTKQTQQNRVHISWDLL